MGILLISVLIGFGCTEKIDIDLDDSYTRLVVYGNVTNETTAHLVEITKTSSYYYSEVPPPVTGANVEIFNDLGETVILTEKEEGKYYTPEDYSAVPGETYTLRIELPEPINENRIYTASTVMQPINPIDSIKLKPQPDWGTDGYMEVQCYYQDPPTKEYYMFNIFKNGIWLTDTITRRFVSDDEFYNGSYTNGIGVGYLDQGNEREITKPGDTVTFQACSITED